MKYLEAGWPYRKKPEADGRPIEYWVDAFATAHEIALGATHGAPIADVFGAPTKIQSLHRVLLISAAPRLLDAVEGIYAALTQNTLAVNHRIEKARDYAADAIELATGKRPG